MHYSVQPQFVQILSYTVLGCSKAPEYC